MADMMNNIKPSELDKVFQRLLREERFGSQAEFVDYLTRHGFRHIHQSKVSRMLTRYGSVRTLHARLGERCEGDECSSRLSPYH